MTENLNPLEISFADVTRANRFTSFGVRYRGEQFGPPHRFQAEAHFDDAAEGQIPCATAEGATICEAIDAMIAAAAKKRSSPLYGEDALMEKAA